MSTSLQIAFYTNRTTFANTISFIFKLRRIVSFLAYCAQNIRTGCDGSTSPSSQNIQVRSELQFQRVFLNAWFSYNISRIFFASFIFPLLITPTNCILEELLAQRLSLACKLFIHEGTYSSYNFLPKSFTPPSLVAHSVMYIAANSFPRILCKSILWAEATCYERLHVCHGGFGLLSNNQWTQNYFLIIALYKSNHKTFSPDLWSSP